MSEGNLFVALDVSLEKTALCVMAADGSIRRESVVPTDAEAIADALAEYRRGIVQVGLESGPMSEWLVRGLETRGIPAVLMETRQVRAALSAMIVKTDRKDARGMANLLRMGWFRPVNFERARSIRLYHDSLERTRDALGPARARRASSGSAS